MATTSPVTEDAAVTFYHEHCTYLPAMLGWFFFSAILSELSVCLFVCLFVCLLRGQCITRLYVPYSSYPSNTSLYNYTI